MIIEDLGFKFFCQSPKQKSLVPHFEESVESYTANRKHLYPIEAPHSISTNYNFLETLEERLVTEQTTVFRHYDTVSEYRQLADKQRLQ